MLIKGCLFSFLNLFKQKVLSDPFISHFFSWRTIRTVHTLVFFVLQQLCLYQGLEIPLHLHRISFSDIQISFFMSEWPIQSIGFWGCLMESIETNPAKQCFCEQPCLRKGLCINSNIAYHSVKDLLAQMTFPADTSQAGGKAGRVPFCLSQGGFFLSPWHGLILSYHPPASLGWGWGVSLRKFWERNAICSVN